MKENLVLEVLKKKSKHRKVLELELSKRRRQRSRVDLSSKRVEVDGCNSDGNIHSFLRSMLSEAQILGLAPIDTSSRGTEARLMTLAFFCALVCAVQEAPDGGQTARFASRRLELVMTVMKVIDARQS